VGGKRLAGNVIVTDSTGLAPVGTSFAGV